MKNDSVYIYIYACVCLSKLDRIFTRIRSISKLFVSKRIVPLVSKHIISYRASDKHLWRSFEEGEEEATKIAVERLMTAIPPDSRIEFHLPPIRATFPRDHESRHVDLTASTLSLSLLLLVNEFVLRIPRTGFQTDHLHRDGTILRDQP